MLRSCEVGELLLRLWVGRVAGSVGGWDLQDVQLSRSHGDHVQPHHTTLTSPVCRPSPTRQHSSLSSLTASPGWPPLRAGWASGGKSSDTRERIEDGGWLVRENVWRDWLTSECCDGGRLAALTRSSRGSSWSVTREPHRKWGRGSLRDFWRFLEIG